MPWLTSTTGVVFTVSVSFGRSTSVSPSSRLRPDVQVGLGGRAAFGHGEALVVGDRVLSLTGVMVIVTVAVSVLPAPSSRPRR